MTTPSTSDTGVIIKTKHIPIVLAWYFMRSHLEIDGQPVTTKRKSWGETFVALQPGQHTLYCYAKSFLGFGMKVGKSTTTIDVAPGQVVHVTWKTPFFVMPFLKGKWSVQTAPALAA